MTIRTASSKQIFAEALDLLVIPVVNKKLPVLPLAKSDPLALELHRHANLEEMNEGGACVTFYPHRANTKRIALVAVKKKADLHALRSCFDQAARLGAKANALGILLPDKADEAFATQAVLAVQTAWYDPKITGTPNDKKQLCIFGNKKSQRLSERSELVAQSVDLVKKLSNAPANLMTPRVLESEAKTIAKQFKLKFRSYGEAEMRKLSMGGILGVSQGSDEEARLIIVEYNPSAKKTLALIGKGITFDSGGISLKHSKTLADMKHDMTGGANVLALVAAAARLKVPYRVVGAIAATENLPSGKALKPGDVITSHSGKTIEVLNTDAEGRLVLADALSFVQKEYKPKAIIDIATLTSAIIVSLGNDITGAFGNSARLNNQLLSAAKVSGENFHFMPLHAKYKKALPSKVADLRNVGQFRSDAIFAALFLQEFIENNTPWLHLDIAGTSWDDKGATGATVPTLIKMFEKLKL